MLENAIFLDRDGTINEDVGDLCTIEKLIFIPDALKALRILQKKFLLFIITNQAGISKEIFTESDFLKFNKKYIKILEKNGIKIMRVYYCPHTREEKCLCQKPNPYFVKKAEKEFNLNRNKSFVIGDHPSDVEMGYNMNIKTVYLLTGHGKKHLRELKIKPNLIAKNIYEATLLIDKEIDN